MTDVFIDGFIRCVNYIALDYYVLGFNGVIFAFFVIFLFTDKRKSFPHLCFTVVAAQALVLTVIAKNYFIILTCVSSIFASFLYFFLKIPKSKRKVCANMNAEQLIKTLDKRLRDGETYRPQAVMQEKDIPLPMMQSELNGIKKGLNVSHARSIIEKLNLMDLSATDKLKVSEIEQSLYELEKESGTVSFFKVNEKLSLLIKILAKYQA